MISWNLHSPVSDMTAAFLPLPNAPNLQPESLPAVFVKRDDLIHPYVSGNKWRKLKYIFQDMQNRRVRHLVTFGGAWSNHLLATACAGAMYGVRTSAMVRTDPGVSNPVLTLCKLYGMELITVDRASYRDKKALYQDFIEERNLSEEEVIFVDEGGYSQEAVRGCAELIGELTASYDHIFCACGTGATLAGLCRGVRESALPTRLHGIPVLAGGQFIADQVRALEPDATFDLHLDYHAGGYARTTPELIAFIKDFVSRTGILIEPVYTGKLFMGVLDLVAKGYFQPEERILIVHSGGLTGLLGMQGRFE